MTETPPASIHASRYGIGARLPVAPESVRMIIRRAPFAGDTDHHIGVPDDEREVVNFREDRKTDGLSISTVDRQRMLLQWILMTGLACTTARCWMPSCTEMVPFRGYQNFSG